VRLDVHLVKAHQDLVSAEVAALFQSPDYQVSDKFQNQRFAPTQVRPDIRHLFPSLQSYSMDYRNSRDVRELSGVHLDIAQLPRLRHLDFIGLYCDDNERGNLADLLPSVFRFNRVRL
jgi:hypothetical protein